MSSSNPPGSIHNLICAPGTDQYQDCTIHHSEEVLNAVDYVDIYSQSPASSLFMITAFALNIASTWSPSLLGGYAMECEEVEWEDHQVKDTAKKDNKLTTSGRQKRAPLQAQAKNMRGNNHYLYLVNLDGISTKGVLKFVYILGVFRLWPLTNAPIRTRVACALIYSVLTVTCVDHPNLVSYSFLEP